MNSAIALLQILILLLAFFFTLLLILLRQPRWLLSLAARLMPGALYAVDLAPAPTSDLAPADKTNKTIALTIDDGPSLVTADILAVLAKHNAKATFFNISGNISHHADIVQQTVGSNHELGNHLTADAPSIRLSPAAFERDLLIADRALSSFLQPTDSPLRTRLHWLRPGMGFYNRTMVNIAQQYGYQLVLGSVFPYDTHIPSSRFASAFILDTVRPGDIIVLHDGPGRGKRTAQTLDKVLPALQAKGYSVTTVTELMALASAPAVK